MKNIKICLPELPVIIYNVSYISAYGTTEKITVGGPIEIIQAPGISSLEELKPTQLLTEDAKVDSGLKLLLHQFKLRY